MNVNYFIIQHNHSSTLAPSEIISFVENPNDPIGGPYNKISYSGLLFLFNFLSIDMSS